MSPYYKTVENMKTKLDLNKKLQTKYFDLLNAADDRYQTEIDCIEELMKLDTGIDDIEFIWVDGCIVGIGNSDHTMKLIHREG